MEKASIIVCIFRILENTTPSFVNGPLIAVKNIWITENDGAYDMTTAEIWLRLLNLVCEK